MFKTLAKLWDHQHWGIGLVRQPIHRFLDPGFQPEVEWLNDSTFSADPFLVEYGTKRAVLFEEFDYRSHRGRISAVDVDERGFGAIHRNVIEDSHHFSYPFTLEWEGELYAIPEHSRSGKLQLYRCIEFPTRWEPDKILLEDVPAVDPTLIFHDGRWWLFLTRQDVRPNEQLWIYSSLSPFGPWNQHPANPAKRDLASARPAGRIFEHEGCLYRPAQDCSGRYGGALVFHRIEELSDRAYRETEVRRLNPLVSSPFPRGIHHISGLGEWTVLDGMRRTYSWHETLFVLKHWIKKIIPS